MMTIKAEAVDALELALQGVLGEKYESEIRGVLEGQSWYSDDLPIAEAFRLWVSTSALHAQSATWIFEPVRAGERKFLSDRVGLERSAIVGKTPLALAEAVLEAIGLPVPRVTGVDDNVYEWSRLVDLVDNGEDERAAVISRQRAERLLRKLVHFFASISFSDLLVSMLESPGSLMLPGRLRTALDGDLNERASRITSLFVEDGWADLGFLALALRKFSYGSRRLA